MKVSTQPPETDLILPTPDGADWDGLTIHTHYFGFSIPQQALSAFIYLRAQPVYGLCSGGVCLFRGLDNQRPLDCEHIDYRNTMPWPTMTANSFTTQNGLRIEFTEPGSAVDVSYRSIERDVSFDLRLTAITSLLVRGHVMPGEDRDSDRAAAPGGSEQFMHCTGTLTLGEANYSVDCYPIRDRSWRQVRTEAPNDYPPVGWTPMCFGPDLMFNQVGFEDPAGDPPHLEEPLHPSCGRASPLLRLRRRRRRRATVDVRAAHRARAPPRHWWCNAAGRSRPRRGRGHAHLSR